MNGKITEEHRRKPAYVYIRQSTPSQVRHHQESTQRQYALRERALELGWDESAIRVLDRDLGRSAQTAGREDFKTLVADVSMGQVGAVFALEASRLARSNVDWHRLLQLCAFTDTLVIDADGCYNPADFNDGLLLGLKGTMAQAELHFLRARLQGGKLNKAKRGELRVPLPVGLCYDARGQVVVDSDQEVRGAVALIFRQFQASGSAHAVMQWFVTHQLRFPKRRHGGVWNGKLEWGNLTYERTLQVLKNPTYAGAYTFGRHQCQRGLTPDGEVRSHIKTVERSQWRVLLLNHHEGFVDWEQFERNQLRLEKNRTSVPPMIPGGAPREGAALLQGLLMCGKCGRRLCVRYSGNGGLYPTYLCGAKHREGMSTKDCMSVRCDPLDVAVAEQVLDALQPAELELAMSVLTNLEGRDQALMHQWRMRLERAEYEAALAERRYQEADPSNRLVTSTLERWWNEALLRVEEIKYQKAEAQHRMAQVITEEQRAEVMTLARELPRLWNAPSTSAKDRKRMLRLLIKDITVEKRLAPKQAVLHIRWQGGACSDVTVELPLPLADRVRCCEVTVARVRALARNLSDALIAQQLNREGVRSPLGKEFNDSMVRWIRWRHAIPAPMFKKAEELTVPQIAKRFGVSVSKVHYWIARKILAARQLKSKGPYWVTLDELTERKLRASQPQRSKSAAVRGAI
jgi:DNA invertase Pin-like site-specific DNA recombinase